MTQNASDVEIANQGFAAFRQDLNDVLEDITTLHSGNTAPTTTYASMWWYEEDTDKLYIRNEDNDAWIELFTLDQVNDKIAALTVSAATIEGDLTVDTDTLIVDSTNNNVLVGKTSDAFGTAGVEIRSEGRTRTTRDGGSVALFNRLNSDGNILEFYKDSSSVGSIGIESAYGFYIDGESGHTGWQFAANNIIPRDNGSRTDNSTDLGSASFRFNDLYLGGGVYVGGTGSANHLDDYEEGTWTPTLTASTSNPTVGYSSFRAGTYVKIGKLVYCTFIMDLSSCSGGSGTALINNLPFTVENNNASYGAQPLLVDLLDSDQQQVHLQPIPNTTQVAVTCRAGKNGGHAGLDIGVVNNSSFRGSMTYRSA